jgi:ankyrin repeat protein
MPAQPFSSRTLAPLCFVVWSLFCSCANASTALLHAAETGNAEAVRAELAKGADVNFTLPNKNPRYGYLVYTALEKAALNGHADLVALLLANGAQVRSDQWYGLYAATWAGQAGHTEVLSTLLADTDPASAQLNELYGPALISAARNGRADSVSLLLERGVSPNWHTPGDHFPRPAVLEAQRTGQSEIFLALLNAGADPKPYPEILALTAMRGDAEMVERLLNMGMDPNADTDIGLPLSLAACMLTGSSPDYQARINATVAVLLAAESRVNVPARGRSPLFCATEDRNEELIAMLQERDARSFETAGRKLRRLGWQAVFTLGDH